MKTVCPNCGARLRIAPTRVPAETVRVKCSKCLNAFVVELLQGEKVPSVSPSKTPSRPVVLIVDDARFFREMLSDILKPLAVTLMTAADGPEALEIARRELPALVILDLNLPGMDGFELIRRLRGESASDSLRLLAISAVFRTEADISEAEKAGVDAFLPKSFRPAHLLQEVQRLLERP